MNRRTLIPSLLLLLATACGDDPVRVEPPPDAPVWSEITTLPIVHTFYGLWAPTPDYVIAVGPRGRVMRFDGTRWSGVPSDANRDLWAIAGATGHTLVAVGDDGLACMFDGVRFVIVNTPTVEDLRDVAMAAPDTFIAVGDGGTVLRGDGLSWSAEDSPTNNTLFGVWAASPRHAVAVGLGGTILRYDGVAWSLMESGTTALLAAVSGTSPDDIYAVGEYGTILHYNGVAWQPMTSGTGEVLQDVWAGGATTAVGANGTILRLDAGAWSPVPGVTRDWLYAIACPGTSTWMAGARTVVRTDGSTWTRPVRGLIPYVNDLGDASGGAITLAGVSGYIVRGTASAWSLEESGITNELHAVKRAGTGERLAAGANHILRRDGGDWVVEVTDAQTYFDIADAHGLTIAVGASGLMRRRIGTTWTTVPTTLRVFEDLHAVSIASPTLAVAVGGAGRMMGYNGITWSPLPTRTTRDLFDVRIAGPDDVIPGSETLRGVAVGDNGVTLGLDAGGSWVLLPSPTTLALRALAVGPGRLLYAVGAGGTVLRLARDTWRIVPSPTTRSFRAAWSRDSTLFLAGGDALDGGLLFRYGPP